MKIFISWSGERGAKIGHVFNKYTRYIIPDSEIFYSPDIDRGIRWFEEISKQLDEADVGIVCLTRDNLDSHWMLFESGALAKKMEKSRLCTFLFDLKPSDVKDPLALFNHTKNTKKGIKKLYQTLDNQRESSWSDQDFDNIFNQWWPEIENDLKAIPKEEIAESEPIRDEREVLDEILNIMRSEKKDYGVKYIPVNAREKEIQIMGYKYLLELERNNKQLSIVDHILHYYKNSNPIVSLKGKNKVLIMVSQRFPDEVYNEISSMVSIKSIKIFHPEKSHYGIDDF